MEMMMERQRPDGPAAEPSDTELIRWLDGELSGEAATRIETRIASDPGTAARLDTLRRRTAALSDLLTELDPAAEEAEASAILIRPALSRAGADRSRARGLAWIPRWRSAPAPARAAAVIAVLLGVTVAVPPLRAWVVDQARAAAEAVGLVERGMPSGVGHEAGTTAPRDAAVAFSFPVEGDAFEVEMVGAGGVLLVRTGSGELGTFEAAGAPDARVLLLPGALRVEGPVPAGASFRIALPAHVTTLRVRAAGEPPATHALPGDGRELRITVP